MESLLVELAWKSVVTSGGALLLLHLLRHRTAAERSMVAHAGLLATLLLPAAVILLPAWSVETPAALPSALADMTSVNANVANANAPILVKTAPGGVGLLAWSYMLPAALLLLATLTAVARLFLLRARASVLVDMSWLSALAHAQRRMGFKHGTALLVSDDLVSPVSWGVMRPIILLDSRAAAATHEAEAIIAHELAHVARLDWAKLLAARLATALFWFNPLVWKLAAECHQLREEAADDAVLHSQVDGPDYASLLVGAARHENKALLLAAHGVAPGKSSLSRRVARVLDQGLSRAPARRTWVLICSTAAVMLSAPLAALTPVAPGLDMVEAGSETLVASINAPSFTIERVPVPAMPSVRSRTVAVAVPTSVLTSASPRSGPPSRTELAARVPTEMSADGPRALPINIAPAPPTLPQPSLAAATARVSAAAQATAVAVAGTRPDLDTIISRKIHGVTPEYAASIAAANPRLHGLPDKELIAFRIHGITPEYIRGLADAGYANLSSRDLLNAKIMGVSPTYVRELAAVGYGGLSLRQITKMRTHGVTPAYVRELRRAGLTGLSAAELVKMRIFGVDAADFGGARGAVRDRSPDDDPDG